MIITCSLQIPSNSIYKLMPDGTVSLFIQPSGYKGTDKFRGPRARFERHDC